MRRQTPVSARHTCDNPDWFTPTPIVERARATLGTIDLDPASDAVANRVVQATRFYTVADDGLRQPWSGRVFLNPPGGLVRQFWRRLCAEYLRTVDEAVWIGFSLEQLQTLQRTAALFTPLTAGALCVPRTRIHFIENEAMRVERLKRIDSINDLRRAHGEPLRKRTLEPEAPTHANYISYLGPRPEAFQEAFRTLGQVIVR